MLSLSLRFSGYYNILYIPFIFSHACYMPKHLNYSMGYPLSSTFPRYKSVYISLNSLCPTLLSYWRAKSRIHIFFDYYFSSISHLLHAENVMIQRPRPYRPFPTTTLRVFRNFPMRVTYPFCSSLSIYVTLHTLWHFLVLKLREEL